MKNFSIDDEKPMFKVSNDDAVSGEKADSEKSCYSCFDAEKSVGRTARTLSRSRGGQTVPTAPSHALDHSIKQRRCGGAWFPDTFVHIHHRT